MAAEPTVEPTALLEERPEDDEGEESDEYEVEGEEDEGDAFEPGQYEGEEDEEGEEGELEGEGKHPSMTALLLSEQNGAGVNVEEYDEDEDEEYQDDGGEVTAERPFDLSSVAGSKRGADELSGSDAEGDAFQDVEEEGSGESAAKKVKV
ncbi:hypothetical protein PAXRUDRAFT_823310 [Paxillus rubicundulus Ve08.2h10]|uniref:Uncharacterized protein n=1 Tax=Paxillus rubicundulus Ve08.2h10 TaxID=930991 RepID=A0A0D0E900_9AGAM|nr:hypothetical protein PAXRUDRAFT_823310 [Paxillus rubicundulus Ve08.2h10]